MAHKHPLQFGTLTIYNGALNLLACCLPNSKTAANSPANDAPNSDSESDLGEVEDLGYMCCSGINNCIDSISKSFNNCATSFFDRWMSCCFDEDITDDKKTYKKVVSVEV